MLRSAGNGQKVKTAVRLDDLHNLGKFAQLFGTAQPWNHPNQRRLLVFARRAAHCVPILYRPLCSNVWRIRGRNRRPGYALNVSIRKEKLDASIVPFPQRLPTHANLYHHMPPHPSMALELRRQNTMMTICARCSTTASSGGSSSRAQSRTHRLESWAINT